MMKKYFLILFMASLLFSCSDDEKLLFDVDLADLAVSFEPFEGGAYLNYSLPANTAIYGIQAKYKDYKGQELVVKGTHTNNQLELFGFNEAQTEVPVEISLLDLEGNASETVTRTFNTKSSAAFSVFDELEVNPHWNGFRVSYPAFEGRAEGIVNIYYIGVNPKTNLIDSLLVSSLPFAADGYTVKYADLEDESIDAVTVIVKSEDARGNVVKKKIFEDVAVSHAGQFPSGNIGFSGSSEENDTKKRGWMYLFDGDVRGSQCLLKGDDKKDYSYRSLAGAEFDGNNVITLDLQNEHEIAWIRIYSHLSAKIPNSFTSGRTLMTMKLEYQFFYPNSVTLYGTNDTDAPEAEWDEISSFYESATLDRESRWTAPAFDEETYLTVDEYDLFQDSDPNYIQLNCDITGLSYRYLKVKINETYYSGNYGLTGVFGMEELEVYVKPE
ncbi:uncharacterized protein DUF4959 [Mangrovibacterium diazotrophicum]|uniref:Uncharacterized protein DUF4959 n=2 Tax=Mangrovibacterium diazotrophicum TaxID=1261403 RepID=A0A419VUH2_9BACT|nr:uncharacterized protein DUF4959 [Mangrovibacterium diazotrophicum]